MVIYLPEELQHNILIRLPAKSLMRFRCVCKSWYTLISSSSFISSHLSHIQTCGKFSVLARQHLSFSKEIYTLHNDDEHFSTFETIDLPFKSKATCFAIIGCVNGLVCLWDCGLRGARNASNSGLMIWNPAIRKCIIVPDQVTSSMHAGMFVFRVFGFGYDALADDYKVVGIAAYYEKGKRNEGSGTVFSLRARSWRRINFCPPFKIYSPSCTLGGVIYRITPARNHHLIIVSFDLSSEVHSHFQCPKEVKTDVPDCRTDLSIFCDSLALIHEWNQRRYHIWLLRDEGAAKSWTKQFSIDLDQTPSGQHIVGFSKNGLLMLVGAGRLVGSSAAENPKIVNLQPAKWHVESYKESLVLLQEGDDVPLSA